MHDVQVQGYEAILDNHTGPQCTIITVYTMSAKYFGSHVVKKKDIVGGHLRFFKFAI